jgi:hypothetical protein
MTSGTWKIVMSGQQVQVQRSITLTVGVPQTSTVTVCKIPLHTLRFVNAKVLLKATPTIVLGITSTPKAISTFFPRKRTPKIAHIGPGSSGKQFVRGDTQD